MYDHRPTCISGAQAHERLTEIGYVQNLDGIMSRQYSKEYPDGLVVTALVMIDRYQQDLGSPLLDKEWALRQPVVVHYNVKTYPRL